MDLSGPIGRDDHRRRNRGAERTELGHGDLEVGEELEQVRLELLVGSIDLVDEQHRRRAIPGDRLEERALDQEPLAVDPLARLAPAAFTLGEAYFEDLPRVIPVIDRGRDVEAFIALKPDQLPVERGCESLRDLGLAHTGLALDEQGLPQAKRKKQRDREGAIGDIALAVERACHLFDGAHGRRFHDSGCYERVTRRAPAPLRRRTSSRSVSFARVGWRARSLVSRKW